MHGQKRDIEPTHAIIREIYKQRKQKQNFHVNGSKKQILKNILRFFSASVRRPGCSAEWTPYRNRLHVQRRRVLYVSRGIHDDWLQQQEMPLHRHMERKSTRLPRFVTTRTHTPYGYIYIKLECLVALCRAMLTNHMIIRGELDL